jgi:hypothetical protein
MGCVKFYVKMEGQVCGTVKSQELTLETTNHEACLGGQNPNLIMRGPPRGGPSRRNIPFWEPVKLIFHRSLCSALFSISELALTSCICYSKYRQHDPCAAARLIEAQTEKKMLFIDQDGSPSGDRTNQASVLSVRFQRAFQNQTLGHRGVILLGPRPSFFKEHAPISESETLQSCQVATHNGIPQRDH